MRRILAALVLALALAPPASAATIRVALTAQTHHPIVGKTWWYQVKVTNAAGKPIPAKIHLQILFGGAPVGQVGVHKVANGVWREVIGKGANQPFPAAEAGAATASATRPIRSSRRISPPVYDTMRS